MKQFCLLIAFLFLLFSAPLPTQGKALAVKSIRTLADAEGTEYLCRLSPDGSKYCELVGNRTLRVKSSDGTLLCRPDLQISIDHYNLSWSPDSKKLVFTENFFQYLLEPDIYTLDISTGAVTNHADDGINVIRLSENPPGMLVDLSPVWAEDGKRIYFHRLTPANGGSFGTALMELDFATGKLRTVKDLSGANTGKYSRVFEEKNGRILYVLDNIDSQEVRQIDRDGHDLGLVGSFADSYHKWIFKASGSSDRQWIAIAVDSDYNRGIFSAEPFPRAIDLRIRFMSTSMFFFPITSSTEESVNGFCFQPTGACFIYTVQNRKYPDKTGLYFMSKPGEKPLLLLPGAVAPDLPGIGRLDWAANNMVIVRGKEGVMLVELEWR